MPGGVFVGIEPESLVDMRKRYLWLTEKEQGLTKVK
jgi:hypothetical protein